MNRTIICIYGRSREGKTETVRNVCQILRAYTNAVMSPADVDFTVDIHCTVRVGNILIGFHSQGDPVGQRRWQELEDLAMQNCDIIVCASRTRGDTVHAVDDVANNHGYDTLWISSFFSPGLEHAVLNVKAAENVVEIIRSLIVTEL